MTSNPLDHKKIIENLANLKVSRNSIFPYFKIHKNKFLRLVLDLTDRCNLRCKMCFFNFPEKKKSMPDMSNKTFNLIASQIFPISSHLTLSCMAEPLLYKKFPEVLSEVSKHEFLYSEYVTNGMLLNSRIIEKSIEANISTVQISFDGAKPETLEKIRIGANFKKIIDNIQMFNKIKSDYKVKHPFIRFNYVIMKDNVNEVVDVVKLAREIGVNEINFRHLVPLKGLGVKLQSLKYNKSNSDTYLHKAKEDAQKFGISLIGFPLLEPETNNEDKFHNSLCDKRCFLPWEQVHILPDGRIIPCPFWYNEKAFGDLNETSFDSIWNSDNYNLLRWELETGRWRKICRTCPFRVLGDIYSGNFEEEVMWGPSI